MLLDLSRPTGCRPSGTGAPTSAALADAELRRPGARRSARRSATARWTSPTRSPCCPSTPPPGWAGPAWRAAGRAGLVDRVPGPPGPAERPAEGEPACWSTGRGRSVAELVAGARDRAARVRPAPAAGRAAQRRRRAVLGRRAAAGAAGPGAGGRAARLHRPAHHGADPAAAAVHGTGVHSRESRMGRPGLDSAYLLMAGTAGFGFRHGEVWGVHLGWSGNQNMYAERLYNGARVLGCCGAAGAGRGRSSSRGRRYRTPWTYASYGAGIDALAGRFHRLPAGPAGASASPRPVLLNTWEAIYFDHACPSCRSWPIGRPRSGSSGSSSTTAGSAGRRDDTEQPRRLVGLRRRLAGGTGPAGRPRPRAAGWSSGSGSSRRWSTWTPTSPGPIPSGCSAPAAGPGCPRGTSTCSTWPTPAPTTTCCRAWIELLETYDIAYLKWDHNRNLNDAGHTPDGTPGVHAHTLAVYRLLDELRAAHPGPGDRVLRRRRRRGSTSASWSGPTGSGRATASTRSSGSRSSATPSCSCRRS